MTFLKLLSFSIDRKRGS